MHGPIPFISNNSQHTHTIQQNKLLVCGWGENLKGLLKTLNIVFDPGTEVVLCNRLSIEEREERMEVMHLGGLELELVHVIGNPATWATLNSLDLFLTSPRRTCCLVFRFSKVVEG